MKTALITGASGKIGYFTAEKFLDNGYFVIAQYNENFNELKPLISYAEKNDKVLYCIKADFSFKDGVDELLKQAFKSVKHIDVLVNNAGIDLFKSVTETTDEELDKILSVNTTSVFNLTKKVLPYMIEKKSGKIVNVSSVFGLIGGSMEVAYSLSKSSLIGFTKALAKEVGPSNINVNCVCPGAIDTKMNARLNNEEIGSLVEQTPLGRIGSPKEVAELIYFLSSEKADFITGECIKIDGGWTL